MAPAALTSQLRDTAIRMASPKAVIVCSRNSQPIVGIDRYPVRYRSRWIAPAAASSAAPPILSTRPPPRSSFEVLPGFMSLSTHDTVRRFRLPKTNPGVLLTAASLNYPGSGYVIEVCVHPLVKRSDAMYRRLFVPAGLVAAALIAAGCGSSGNSNTPAGSGGSGSAMHTTAPVSSGNALNTMKIGGATVLTNAKGFTLYWFAPDTSTTSKCNGTCASFWPPVKGPATAGTGVMGKLGTITRS